MKTLNFAFENVENMSNDEIDVLLKGLSSDMPPCYKFVRGAVISDYRFHYDEEEKKYLLVKEDNHYLSPEIAFKSIADIACFVEGVKFMKKLG